MTSWRPALRIARRTIRRNVWRSLLVAILVGVPVAGATLADVLYRSTNGVEREAYRELGTADAEVMVTSANSIPGDWAPRKWDGVGIESLPNDRDAGDVDVASYLPVGSRAVPKSEYAEVRVVKNDGFIRAGVDVLPLGDPLTQHLARLESGTWPNDAGEVAVTRRFADRAGLLRGGELLPNAELEIIDGPAVSVTGISIDPFCLSCESIVATPGSLLANYQPEDQPPPDAYAQAIRHYLVDLPDNVEATTLWPELAKSGIAMVPREVYLEPDAYAGTNLSMDDVQAIALSALVIGLGLLEIVLLAGAAFAVGARRQTRDLGLAAVNGATTQQVRRIVLAQGLALGAIGAVLGLAFGALMVVAGRPLWERLFGQLIDQWRFGIGEIAIAAGVGLFAGLAAAIIPAVGAARMKPVDALAGRFRASKLATRMPILGLILIVLGVATALGGNRLIAGEFAEYKEALKVALPGEWVSTPDTSLAVALQILGAILAVAGIVIAIPALVTSSARLARRLPFLLRYAMRDAARHRHRTAPTVAAIMIVVTGSVALAFVVDGSDHAEKVRYSPSLPHGVMSIYSEPHGPTNPPADGPAPGIAAARDKLPNAGFIEVTTPLYEATPPASVPKADRRPEVSPAVATYETTARCDDDGCWNDLWIGEVALATPDLFELIAGRPMNDSEAQAVEAGNALVFGAEFAGEEGPITIGADDYVYEDPYYDDWAKPERVQLETHVVPLDDVYGSLRFVLIPDHALSDGTTSSASQAFLTYGDAEAEDVSAALAAAELQGAYAHIEEGPDTYAGIIAIILAAASAFVTLVGVAIAVSLASAESRPDYATLGAVGAPPRRRRLVAGAQALVVAVTGTALGLALGSYIAFTAWPTTGSPDFVVPWSNLALTGVAVPVLAVVIAMIFTPSRLPMMRRLD